MRLALLACLSLLLWSTAYGIEVILPAELDTSIFEEAEDRSSGEGPLILAGVTSNRGGNDFYIRRGLMSFDIAGYLPSGAMLESAVLELTIAKVPDEKFLGTAQSLHRVTSEWGAPTGGMGSGASGPPGRGTVAVAGDATWTNRLTGSAAWESAGGDYIGAASATVGVSPAVNEVTTWSSLGLVNDVQLWLDDPTQNFGWILIGSETFEKNARGYYSSDNTDPAAAGNAPRLILNYSIIPEPSHGALYLGLGCLLFGFRRKARG